VDEMHGKRPEAAKSELEHCHEHFSTTENNAGGTGTHVLDNGDKREEKATVAEKACNGYC